MKTKDNTMPNDVTPINDSLPPSRYFSPTSDLYFPVQERSVFYESMAPDQYGRAVYVRDNSHKAIIRDWNGGEKQIGLVGKNYKVLHTEELCLGIEQTFCETMSHSELTGVNRRDRVAHFGGTSIRDYIFPNIRADIGSTKSDIAFRVIVVNGYDGSSSFKFYCGAIDFFCENGMVSGVYDLTVKRHTAGLTVPHLTDRLRKSIDIFYKQADTYKHWVGKEIKDEDAKDCFTAMPSVSERRVDQLMRQFHIECLSHGRTVWALYSAATFYSSFSGGDFTVRETGTDHEASTLMNRERQVRSWLATDEFERIAA
jgi:hypothetical protein